MSGDPVDFDVRPVIPSDERRCAELEGSIIRLARVHAFSDEELSTIRLAVREALSNAFDHGNGRDPAKTIRVEYSIDASIARIRITDQGAGFDPTHVPHPWSSPLRVRTPGGRGLALMRHYHYMTGVRFNDRGNRVEFWKTK